MLCLTILLVTAALIGGSAYLNAHFAVAFLSDHLLNQTSLRISQYISNVLEGAMIQAEENANLIANGFLEPREPSTMTRFFHVTCSPKTVPV